MDFTECEEDCPYRKGMPGILSQGYYPSSPKEPKFAIATDIFQFFHLLHMKSASSKQGFCNALQTYLELLKILPENGCEVILEPLLNNSNRRSLQIYTTISLGCTPPG